MNKPLALKLQSLPNKPGCYQMKDINNNIIYVGKAKDLKKRVNQYFVGAHDFKTTKLVSNIVDVDFIVTHTEKEALLLEINLIKKYSPRYNIMFMDDKSYPYLKLEKKSYPSLKVVRESKKDAKAKYFGPYPDVASARFTWQLLNQIFPLRKCRVLPKKVCLYYHMNQCLGPCEYTIDQTIQQQMIEDVTRFLNGDTSLVLNRLKERLNIFVDNLQFEKAQEINELIGAINKTVDKQNVDFSSIKNADVINYFLDKDYISITILQIKNQKLLHKTENLLPIYGNYQDEMISYIMQYYQLHDLPLEVILPTELSNEYLDELLNNRAVFPTKGVKNKLLTMAYDNAKINHQTRFENQLRIDSNLQAALLELDRLFNKNIKTIEIFDNSNISGSHNVSAMVVFEDGLPNKNKYRHFKLEDRQDDYASMYEVLYRRYLRLLKDDGEFPDLVLLDGGKGQISICKKVFEELDLNITIAGLVKDGKHQTTALLNVDGEKLPLNKESQLFFLLTRMQVEVHRFALSYHTKLRSKAMKKSILDDIEGVGPNRKTKLMKHFKSIKNIEKASFEELKDIVGEKVAKSILETFSKK